MPGPILDPIGRLDDVMATLEEMLDHHRVPPAPPSRGAAGPESPEIPEIPERPAGDPGDPEGPETLPLLRDVVAPAADGEAEGAGGEPEAAGPEEEDEPVSAPAPERESLPAWFEIIPDEPLPRIGDLDLDLHPGGAGSGGERYGDAAPPSLDPEVYRHLIDRLENEIDVIVQAGAEEAMQRAAADIAARVREHVAITLPEVIDELVRMSSRPRG